MPARERVIPKPQEQTEPVIPSGEVLKRQVRSHDRLTLYYRPAQGGRTVIYAGKTSRIWLAEAVPWNKISISRMILEANSAFVNMPTIPTPSRRPSIEMVAKELFSYFIPRFFPFAAGKPIDLYKISQKRSEEKPEVRVCFRRNLVVISHPKRELGDNPSPKSLYPKACNPTF